jgi:hypothetical protein
MYKFRRVHRLAEISIVCVWVRLLFCPSVSMEQLGSQWTDFHEIRYLNFFFENLITRTRKLTLLLNVKPDGASSNQHALKS